MQDLAPLNEDEQLHNNRRNLVFALAGNANVGKSVLFNQLTGSSQIIGNWPGKTIEKAQGTLDFEGQKIIIVDLPGIYSFSTFSMEEIVSREYVALENPDVVINVVDAAVLERNLFFTIQLMEMEVPLLLCLNQVDAANKKGITIDLKKLEQSLGVPVVPTVAVRGEGIYELTKKAVEMARRKGAKKSKPVKYGSEIEEKIQKLSSSIESKKIVQKYPARWIAVKLLESDPEVQRLVSSKSQDILREAEIVGEEIFQIHREQAFVVIASERYALASKIANEAQKQALMKTTLSDRLEWATTHRVLGYFTSAAVIAGLLLWTFTIGNFLSTLLSDMLKVISPVNPALNGSIWGILWNGIFGGFVAGVTLIIPYVIPFYLMLSMIEDSGILTRVAFMMDSAMHKIGLHGKALIPLILGFGCNVPAIRSCRIMETKRERLLAAFAITFAPCAARTILILGLVAAFLGSAWALALYAVDIVIIFIMGRIALKVVPGQSTGLIMEMHSFKLPSLSVIGKQTWVRTKSLIYIVFPIYVVGSALIQMFYALGVLGSVSSAISPLTVGWLGLPAFAGILLILGIVRKEFILLGAVAIFGSTNLLLFLTPVQLVTLALVGILYLPCLSTVSVLAKDFGWKAAITISVANLATALIAGGLAFRILSFLL